MSVPEARARIDVGHIAAYPDRIDARSPREFADDHVPGATNHPVLDDDERARVGTLYMRSPFDARKLGAALVARNIARMLESSFADRDREWRPLVYCWRGGQRSRSLGHVLNEIGWRAVTLEGGYRAYRRHVLAQLAALPGAFELVVVSGLTGAGKSRLLGALAQAGAQTLDLEGLARHRGSVLGGVPGAPQPSQRAFESALLDRLEHLDRTRPVFIEGESRRIGALDVPTALLDRMRSAPGVELVTPRALRVALLIEDYAHFQASPRDLVERLAPLTPLHGKETLARWAAAAEAGDWHMLVEELLERHYDPIYARSLHRNFAPRPAARTFSPAAADDDAFAALATRVLQAVAPGELALAPAS